MNCTCVPVSAQPVEPTVENLIVRLADLRKRRADIEKAEGETTAMLKEKLRQQRQRLNGLGVTEDGPQKGNLTPPPLVETLPMPMSSIPAVKPPISDPREADTTLLTPPPLPRGDAKTVASPE